MSPKSSMRNCLIAAVLSVLSVQVRAGCRLLVATNEYVETVSGWTTNNWVFAPTVLYGGNRYPSVSTPYSPYVPNVPDGARAVITDVYRLSNDGRAASVEWLAGDSTAPMMGWWDPAKREGVLIFADPFTSVGETGFRITEDPVARTCQFAVQAPGVRSRRYRMCRFESPSGDRPAAKGQCVALPIRRMTFSCGSVVAFLDVALTNRKLVTGPAERPQIEPFGWLLDTLLSGDDKRILDRPLKNLGYIPKRFHNPLTL